MHKFCRKTQFACPRCNKVITESKLSEKSIDEITADVDTYNRRKVKEIYNMQQEDFDDIDEYREYEEMVEDIIYSLTYGSDEEINGALAKIESYKNAPSNQQNILANSERNLRQKDELERQLMREMEEKKRKQEEYQRLDEQEAILAREEALKRNRAMLGDQVDFMSSIDTLASTKASIIPSKDLDISEDIANVGTRLAAMLVLQQPLPKVLKSRDSHKNIDKSQERAMHLAGGYDYVIYSRRNWQEILNGVNYVEETRPGALVRAEAKEII